MGMYVYALREVSLRNYDSALGASPLGSYHNSFVMFPIVRTRPYINNYIIYPKEVVNTGNIN